MIDPAVKISWAVSCMVFGWMWAKKVVTKAYCVDWCGGWYFAATAMKLTCVRSYGCGTMEIRL